ncbi:AmpG family muropeptide MFS transporter [Frateuria aurantia]
MSPTPRQGWGARLKAQFATPASVTLLLLGFGSGLPYLLIGYTLSIWLREAGWALGPIGLVSYIGLLYQFKFLWAPWLDSRRPPWLGRLGRRRGWMLGAQMCLVVGLAAIGWVGPQHSVPLFLALVTLTALAGATQDVMVDAYRIEIGPEAAQGALAATNTLGYRLGLICGGALTLYVASASSWRVGYGLMAGLMLVPLLTTLRAREPELTESRLSSPESARGLLKAFSAFFRRCGVALGLGLLAFVGLFKLPDQMLGVIAGPFYLDCGFSPKDIATVSKLYGVWITIGGAFIGGAAIAVWRMSSALVVAALALALSNLLYILMSVYPGQLWSFILTISGDNFSQGFSATVLVAFMSSLTDRRYTATQYALLSSLAFLPGKLVGGVAGYMVQAWGYTPFFVLSTLSIAPTLLVLAWMWPRLVRTDQAGQA